MVFDDLIQLIEALYIKKNFFFSLCFSLGDLFLSVFEFTDLIKILISDIVIFSSKIGFGSFLQMT